MPASCFGLASVHADSHRRIRLALARLAEFADHPHAGMRAALNSALPTWRMLVLDGTM